MSEVCNLRLGDVVLNDRSGHLVVRSGKGGSNVGRACSATIRPKHRRHAGSVTYGYYGCDEHVVT
jgi:hypothetical protein